jgi:molybdate transport system substrate-binding protein
MAKLKVMCARSMHVAVGALGRAFAKAGAHEIDFDFGTVGVLEQRLAAGETADVLILSQPVIDKLEKAGALRPGSRVVVVRTFIAVCIREGAPKPDFSTPEAFRKLLEAADRIAVSDPAVGGSAGVHLARMFEREGLAPLIKAKGLPQQTGAEVAKRVVEGKAGIGLTLSGEVASVPGAVIAGPLPLPFGQDTVYSAAVAAASREPEAAAALITALSRRETRPMWTKAGFEMSS